MFFLQILQSIASQARKTQKSIYVFSVDNNTGSVAHVNFVSASLRTKGVDAREWAASVTTHIGGKVNWLSPNIGGFADQRPRLVVKKTAHKELAQKARR